MPIIEPRQLEADAVVPQCLDNQCISDNILTDMVKEKKSFGDASIKKKREQETHAEFLRSLIYSSQTVVNRAAFKNSHYLIDSLENDIGVVAELINNGTITPYLFKEDSISQTTNHFHTADQSQKLLVKLEEATQDASLLRLAGDRQRNESLADGLTEMFTQFCTSLGRLSYNEKECKKIATQLYANGIATSEPPPQVIVSFKEILKKISEFSSKESERLAANGIPFGRNPIYAAFFCIPKTNVSDGFYLPELTSNPALLMAMKLVDLNYAANLPDKLGRYTLTAASLPGRSALPYSGNSGTDMDGADINAWLTNIKQAVMDTPPHVYEATLPRLRDLTLGEVKQIRELPQWEAFRLAQRQLLTASPVQFGDTFAIYQKALEAFQQSFEAWYLKFGSGKVRTNVVKVREFVHAKWMYGGLIFSILSAAAGDVRLAVDGLETSKTIGEIEHLLPQEVDELVIELCVKSVVQGQKHFSLEYSRRHALVRKVQFERAEMIRLVREFATNGAVRVLRDVADSEKAKS